MSGRSAPAQDRRLLARPFRGPVGRESPPSTRSNSARPAPLSSLHSEQSSDAARHVVPVQRWVDSGHPSLAPSAPQSVHDSACGLLRCPLHVSLYLRHPNERALRARSGSAAMYRCTSAIPMSERSAPAQDRRLRARSSRGPLLLAPRVVRDDISAGRGALGSESEDSGMRAARPDGHRRVDVGSESALLHAPKTGRCRPGLHTYHSHIDRMSRLNKFDQQSI